VKRGEGAGVAVKGGLYVWEISIRKWRESRLIQLSGVEGIDA
jgi:hypothetical protein